MTPTERWRSAERERLRAIRVLQDAEDGLVEAQMEWHYARFVYVAASVECPTCHAAPGAYCAIIQRPDGTYSNAPGWEPEGRLIALFLHPARTTTPEALEVAR